MRIRSTVLLAASAGLCLALTSLPASSAPPADPTQPDAFVPENDQFNLSFQGGSLGDYLDALTDIAGVNIVATQDVRRLPMPSIRLRAVTPFAAVQLVDSMFQDRARGMVMTSEVSDGATTPIYVLNLIRADDAPAVELAVNDVFSIGDVLRPSNEEPADLQIKQIFEMIASAMELSGETDAPEMSFHDDTQMLVFRGSPEQRHLIESVLSRYLQSWQASSRRAEALRREIADLELESKTSSIEAESARNRAEFLARRVDELKNLVEAGGVSASELAGADNDLNMARAQAEIQLARAEHSRTRLAECTTQLATLVPDQQASIVIYDVRDLGPRGANLIQNFRSVLSTAEIPGTTLTINSSLIATLNAQPIVHQAIRFLLESMRSQAQPAGTQ